MPIEISSLRCKNSRRPTLSKRGSQPAGHFNIILRVVKGKARLRRAQHLASCYRQMWQYMSRAIFNKCLCNSTMWTAWLYPNFFDSSGQREGSLWSTNLLLKRTAAAESRWKFRSGGHLRATPWPPRYIEQQPLKLKGWEELILTLSSKAGSKKWVRWPYFPNLSIINSHKEQT